jgi:Ser/Thr protein kinase RdoA (MazF antagonist)
MPDPSLPPTLPVRLRAELGFDVVEATPIDPGVIHNNRLLRLRGADGRELVAKLYYRDDRGRLEREFGAFRLLRERGLAAVPTAHLADAGDYYAVYSFEPGRTRTAAELTLDELAAIGRLAAALQVRRPEDGGGLPLAFAARSLAERIDGLRARLAACRRAAAAPDAYGPLRAVVAEIDLPSVVDRLIAAATDGLTAAELAEPVPEDLLRLNSGDFAPHNIVVRPDGSLCALDFEYAGWDDPAVVPVGFLAADQSDGLSPAQAGAFLNAYRAAVDLPDRAFVHLDRLRALTELGWLLVNLSLMTPAHVARKRFAGDFDLDAHLSERRLKLDARVARVGALSGGAA